MTWTSIPEAADLLRQCVQNPPKRDMRTGSFDRSFPFYRADDPRIRRLRKIRKAAEPPMDTLEWRAWIYCDEQDAVKEAIQGFARDVEGVGKKARATLRATCSRPADHARLRGRGGSRFDQAQGAAR